MAGAGREGLYQKRPDVVSLAVVIGHVAFTLAPLYWAAWRGPDWFLLPFAVWFGCGMHGLLNLMHEAAHFHVFEGRRGSQILGGWLLSPLVIADFDSYRKRHWQHHRELGTPRDTKYTYRMDLQPAALLRFVLRCVLLGEALGKFIHIQGVDRTEEIPAKQAGAGLPGWIVRAAIVQALLGISLMLIAIAGEAQNAVQALGYAAAAYGAVYLYGLAAVTSFVGAIRSVAEHRIGVDDAEEVGFAALRNLKTNAVSRLLLGCHGFAEHAGHHADPRVPAYRLPELIEELAVNDPRQQPSHGYLEICRLLIRESARSGAR